MGAPVFVPYTTKHSVSLGDTAKRVVMTARSPSPTRTPTPSPNPRQQAKLQARRITPVALVAPPTPPSTDGSSDAEGSGSGSSGAGANGHAHAHANGSTPNGTANGHANGNGSSTPSRKGKERQVEANGVGNGNGSPMTPAPSSSANGHAHAHANGHANGTRATANGASSSSSPPPPAKATPKATPNGKNVATAGGGMDLSWPEPFANARKPAGLANGSMACYTNATLQVLLHTPPVLRVALAHRQGDCLIHSKGKFCMLCAIRRMATGEHFTGNKSAYRPVVVHNYLGQIKKGFSKNRQEDAHEFFRFVTDAFQNTALAGQPKDLPEKIKRTSWVYKVWGGQVRSRVLCLSCKKPSDTFDSFLDLSLDVPSRAKSVKDLFETFVHEDRLDGENKYNCENCKKKSAATKSMRIADAPPVLTLHLKRFGFNFHNPGRMSKVNNLIDYPQSLDIAPYMTDPKTAEGGTQYRLFGVTCHHGTSLHYGHYTSYVLGRGGTWFSADDEDVSAVKLSSVLHDRSAYLLSYMRVGPGSQVPVAMSPAATPVSGPASKRRRANESESPNKKLDVRPPLAAAYGGSNGTAGNGVANGLARAYASSDDDDDDALPAPRGVRHDVHASPIARPSHPSPGKSGAFLKGKHHRVNAKHAHGLAHGGKHGGGHKHHGAPMPFAAGKLGGNSSSNMRSSGASRYDAMGGKGGKKMKKSKAMRGKGW